MVHDHLSRPHDHGLPAQIAWLKLATEIESALQREDVLYPPERLWVFGPEGALRGTYLGDDHSVSVPLRELGQLYQAIVVHTHPPGRSPTVKDTWHAIIAASPLLVTLEGDLAHLVTAWHTRPPGLVGRLLEQEDMADLESALRGLRRYGVVTGWRAVRREELSLALAQLQTSWAQFVETAKGH
jgi:hypothetical protein